MPDWPTYTPPNLRDGDLMATLKKFPAPAKGSILVRDLDQFAFYELRAIQQLTGVDVFEAGQAERAQALVWWEARKQHPTEYAQLKFDDVGRWPMSVGKPAPADDDAGDVRTAAEAMGDPEAEGDEPPFTDRSEPEHVSSSTAEPSA